MSQEKKNQSSLSDTPVTLDQAFKALQHWKSNKSEYPKPGIPDQVWKVIFQLESVGYAAKDLKNLFKLGSEQYDKKHAQLLQAPSVDTGKKPVKTDPFCEATLSVKAAVDVPPLTTKKDLAYLKSNQQAPEEYLDLTTIIVECVHSDGRRINIHTTIKSIDQVMKAFFNHGES